jgi:methanethiol S-methyltransferase
MQTFDSSAPPARPGGLAGPVGRTLAVAYGLAAYGLFLGTIGYFVLFVGGISVPKTLDRGDGLPGPAAAVDVLLVLLFGLQHSVMARPGFKQRLSHIVPPTLERSTFVLVSGVMLVLLVALWRPIPALVWYAEPPGAVLVHGVFWTGVLLAVGSTFVFSHAELFGLAQVHAGVRGRPSTAPTFRTPALYRVVRHPMHLGMLVVLWATPRMTAGHLLFALAMTAYVLIGIHFEERDLVRQFGERYRAYRRAVPALVPFPRPGWLLSNQRLGAAAAYERALAATPNRSAALLGLARARTAASDAAGARAAYAQLAANGRRADADLPALAEVRRGAGATSPAARPHEASQRPLPE